MRRRARWHWPSCLSPEPACSRAHPHARARARACARACVRARARACVRVRARACVRACACASAGEAHRSTVPRLEADPLLLPHLATLRDHFGANASGPFEVQRIDLAEGRTAVLVSHPDESDPIVLAFDRDELLWSKPRPTAGILPPVKHLTVLPRPDGGVVIFAWVTSLHMVAARMWGDDGNPFGDFELFAPDACDALSAAYGPGQGWIVACTSRQGTRAQRLREDGAIAWGHDGVGAGIAERVGAGDDCVRLGAPRSWCSSGSPRSVAIASSRSATTRMRSRSGPARRTWEPMSGRADAAKRTGASGSAW